MSSAQAHQKAKNDFPAAPQEFTFFILAGADAKSPETGPSRPPSESTFVLFLIAGDLEDGLSQNDFPAKEQIK
ncbi:MAG: hypothetical protein LBL95_03020 [Deltaproteobacteria bacterium]|jgi:hypothetical protein|nr:hypothetical protein [Deltaproteobacteria bacterium]